MCVFKLLNTVPAGVFTAADVWCTGSAPTVPPTSSSSGAQAHLPTYHSVCLMHDEPWPVAAHTPWPTRSAIDLMDLIAGAPRLPLAACRGQAPLFDKAAGRDPASRRAAVKVCNGCADLAACQCWAATLSPPQRKGLGVVAGAPPPRSKPGGEKSPGVRQPPEHAVVPRRPVQQPAQRPSGRGRGGGDTQADTDRRERTAIRRAARAARAARRQVVS